MLRRCARGYPSGGSSHAGGQSELLAWGELGRAVRARQYAGGGLSVRPSGCGYKAHWGHGTVRRRYADHIPGCIGRPHLLLFPHTVSHKASDDACGKRHWRLRAKHRRHQRRGGLRLRGRAVGGFPQTLYAERSQRGLFPAGGRASAGG